MQILKDSRALFFEMIKKEAENNKDLKGLINDILSGNIKVEDYELQSIRAASQTTKMFKTDDDIVVGIRSLAKAQLEKNQFMLVTRITLLAITLGAAPTDSSMSDSDFGSIKAIPGLQNGEWSFKSMDKYLLKKHVNQCFVTDNNHTITLGTKYLENPRLLIQQEKIEFDIELLDAPPANTVYKLILGGTGTLPA